MHMPRQARLDAPGTVHHVMARGIEGVDIFRADKDREDFLSRLAEQCEAEALKAYAWALLSNHLHLLLRTGNRPIFVSMRKILTGYVVRFNRRHQRQGHLFQNRYKSIICEEDPYLLELTRYIHLNPLRAGIVGNVKELGRYPWTGHSAIVGIVKRDWQETKEILRYFGRRRKTAVKRYIGFLEEGNSLGRRPELVGGGLLRSVGGWSEVVSMRRRGVGMASDERILGSGGFVERVIEEAEARERNVEIEAEGSGSKGIIERSGRERRNGRGGTDSGEKDKGGCKSDEAILSTGCEEIRAYGSKRCTVIGSHNFLGQSIRCLG